MRRFLFPLSLACVLFVAIPASACGGGQGGTLDDGTYRYCHDYTINIGDESNGVHANERGQFLVAAQLQEYGLGGHYVESDIAYVGTDWIFDGSAFSLWYYSETNGHPGAQRNDEVCNNTPDGWESDSIIC